MKNTFKAFVVKLDSNKKYIHNIEEKKIEDLPIGEVLIRVHNSSINYKDILSVLGNPGVTRKYPHTPGIDAAGTVENSTSGNFKKGDKVIVISHDLGMNTPGGFGEYIRVPESWITMLPGNLTLRESMIFGTAGFTAALCVQELICQKVFPINGPILVSGSTGGVGSIVVSILSKLGYEVVASTGKKSSYDYLASIGANEVIDRDVLSISNKMPQLKERWAGCIDTIGGASLETMIKSCKKYGSVICAGNINSQNISVSILPFILRGVKLIGINSEWKNADERNVIWEKLANEWKPDCLEKIAKDCSLDQLFLEIENHIHMKQVGRVVVSLI